MMRSWTVCLPHFLFAWIARRDCEVMDQRAPMGPVVMPRPGVYLKAQKQQAATAIRAHASTLTREES